MKKSHLRHMKRIGILLCLLLILCSAEYLVGASSNGCSLALPSMPSKAIQKKLKARAYAQRRIVRKKMESALSQVQHFYSYLHRQFNEFQYCTKRHLALRFKIAHYECKKEFAVDLEKKLLKKNINAKKKLINAIQHNQWSRQDSLRKDIDITNVLALLSEQRVFSLKNKLEKIYAQGDAIQQRLTNLHVSICNAEKERELQLNLAGKYARRLVTGNLALSTELFSVIPPVDVLDEI